MSRPAALVIAYIVCASAIVEADAETAKLLNERATAAYALGRYNEAAVAWEKAFEEKPVSELLYNAAQAHRLAGNKQRALELYENYLRVYRSKVDNVATVEAQIEALKRSISGESPAAPAEEPIQNNISIPKPSSPPSPSPQQAVTATSPSVTPPSHKGSAAGAIDFKPTPSGAESSSSNGSAPPYRKGWFWGVLAGAAIVVGTGIGVGIATAPGDPIPSLGTARGN